jgi:hypothetical protein
LIAHQTSQSRAMIGTFNATANQTIPQALPLMPRIVPLAALCRSVQTCTPYASVKASFAYAIDA